MLYGEKKTVSGSSQTNNGLLDLFNDGQLYMTITENSTSRKYKWPLVSLLLIWFEVIPASKNLTEVLKGMFEVINGMFIIVDDYSNNIFFSIRSAFMIFLSKIVVVFKENAPYIVGNIKKHFEIEKCSVFFSHI
jgi:hypothetical protein